MEKTIVCFLRKEAVSEGVIRSNGSKLFCDNTCLGQWVNHRIIMNNSKYDDPKMSKCQDILYKWLRKSEIIFTVLNAEIPIGKQDLLKYYGK